MQKGYFTGPKKTDGTPDFRYSANRIPGINKDGTREKRYAYKF